MIQQNVSVGDRTAETGVEDYGNASVICGSDQPSHPLGEGDGGSRDQVVGERVFSLSFDQVHAGGRHRVTDRLERDLLDYQQPQGVTGNVHPLPE